MASASTEETDNVNATGTATAVTNEFACDVGALRSSVFHVGTLAGDLCRVSSQHLPRLPVGASDGEKNVSAEPNAATDETVTVMSGLLAALLATAERLGLDLRRSVRSKMALNAKKYPVELCKGKAGKYTKYSSITGITQDNQSTLDDSVAEDKENSTDSRNCRQPSTSSAAQNCRQPEQQQQQQQQQQPSTSSTVAQSFTEDIAVLCADIDTFAVERQWSKYHLPRNLVLALLGEVGELAEIVQWKGDADTSLTIDERDKLSQELADVSIYLLRLATVTGLSASLQTSLRSKLAKL